MNKMRLFFPIREGVRLTSQLKSQSFFISVQVDSEKGVTELVLGRETEAGLVYLRDYNADGQWDFRWVPRTPAYFVWFDCGWVSVDGLPRKEGETLVARADSVVYRYFEGEWTHE